MVAKKKRFKLIPAGKLVYGAPGTNYWSFVRKVRGGYELLAQPMSCKDYIHEALANHLHDSEIFTNTGHGRGKQINMEKFQIVMFFNNTCDNFKANLYSVKKYINSLEKAHGIKQTSILEIESGFNTCRVFIITAPKEYIESPGLHHGLVAMLRTLHYAKKKITKTNVAEVLGNVKHQDYAVLSFVIKHGVYDKLLKHHKRITDGLPLKKVYPKEVTNKSGTSYHSGFGMVAVCSRRLASKAYSDRVIEVLEEEKIPEY